MTKRGIPAACAVALWMTLPASTLSAGAIACGNGVTCEWMEDSETRGSFVVSHAGALTVTEDPMKGQPHSFVSPSGFWTVVFDSFNQSDGPDGMFAPADQVDVKGYMQHLKRPPDHPTDPQLGEKFSFDLSIYEWIHPEDEASGTVKHGHNDSYYALLAGTDATAPKTGILAYNFGVKGRHPEFFETPQEAPEPATFLLAGAALGLYRLLRQRTAGPRSSRPE